MIYWQLKVRAMVAAKKRDSGSLHISTNNNNNNFTVARS